MRNLLPLFLLTALYGVQLPAQTTDTLTPDGAWCWFSDPRAIYMDGQIITGWVKSSGTIEAAQFDVESGEVQPHELYFRLEQDDHDNPAFAHLASGKVLAMYTRHSYKDLFINILDSLGGEAAFSKPHFIHPISEEELEKFPVETMTYANPYQLAAEDGRIYCFGRWAGFKPNMMWSDDEGATWSRSRVFITNYPFEHNNRPYVKYFSDGQLRIIVASGCAISQN